MQSGPHLWACEHLLSPVQWLDVDNEGLLDHALCCGESADRLNLRLTCMRGQQCLKGQCLDGATGFLGMLGSLMSRWARLALVSMM